MKCSHRGKMLSLYVDGELSERERARLESHVQSCSDCRRALKDLQILKQMFDHAERYRAPYGFAAKVIANAALQKKGRGASIPYFIRFAQVLALIMVLAVGVTSGRLIMQRAPTPNVAALATNFSLEVFETAPPDSLGGAYFAVEEIGHDQ